MRRRLLLAVLVLTVVPALNACGQSTSDLGPVAGPSADPPTGRITFTTTYGPGENGVLYTEGALVEVRLRDRHGRRIDTKIAAPDKPIRFRNLPAGSYRALLALRPCEANCGYLGSRDDGCQQDIVVDSGVVGVHVDFRVGSRCTPSQPTGGHGS